MGIFDVVRIDPTSLKPLTDDAPKRVYTRLIEVDPAQALLWAIGASLQAGTVVGIRSGKRGPVFAAWPLWVCSGQRAVVVAKVSRNNGETTILSGWDALLWDNLHNTGKPGRNSREYYWEVNARLGLNVDALRNGKPILGGRYRTTYSWLE